MDKFGDAQKLAGRPVTMSAGLMMVANVRAKGPPLSYTL